MYLIIYKRKKLVDIKWVLKEVHLHELEYFRLAYPKEENGKLTICSQRLRDMK